MLTQQDLNERIEDTRLACNVMQSLIVGAEHWAGADGIVTAKEVRDAALLLLNMLTRAYLTISTVTLEEANEALAKANAATAPK